MEIKVEGLMCHKCEERCEKVIKALGVKTVKADYEKGIIEVDLDGIALETVKNAIKDAGFDC